MRTATLAVLFCFFSICASAQTNYMSLNVRDKHIYVLNDGILNIYNENGGAKKVVKHAAAIKGVYFDRADNLITVDDHNNIRKLSSNNQWTNIGNYDRKIYSVGFNSRNQCFLATDGGIVDRESGKIYRPDSSLFHSEWSGISTHVADLNQEEAVSPQFTDSFDVLWTSVSHGEWGNDVFAFNTLTKEFIDVKTNGLVPFIEANKKLYAIGVDWIHVYVLKIVPQDLGQQLSFKSFELYNSDKDNALNMLSKRFALSLAAYSYDSQRSKLYVVVSDTVHVADTSQNLNSFSDFRPQQKLNALLKEHKKKLPTAIIPTGIINIAVAANGNIILQRANGSVMIFDGNKLLPLK